MPERIQLKRSKGWKMPPNTVSVARPTKWGNPYRIGEADTPTRAEAVRKYRAMAAASAALAEEALAELRGKNLACWCPLGEPCHADVLLEMANRKQAKRAGDTSR